MTIWDHLEDEPDALETIKNALGSHMLRLPPDKERSRCGELSRLIERAELDEAEEAEGPQIACAECMKLGTCCPECLSLFIQQAT